MNKIKIFMVFLILLISTQFIYSQQEAIFLEDFTDIGLLMGLQENEISGQGVEYQKLNNENARLTFVNEDAEINVKGNIFENIISQGESERPTFIELDEKGKIVKADFMVNERGGTYIFENNKINVPANSNVIFDSKSGIKMNVPDGAEIAEIPALNDESSPSDYITTIESYSNGNFKLPSGDIISGKLKFDGNQAFFTSDDPNILINGIDTGFVPSPNPIGQGSLNYKADLFFDGQVGEGDYVSFDLKNKKLIMSSKGTKPELLFNEDNPFIKIDEGDHVLIRNSFNSEIEIQNRDIGGLIPKVTTKGEFSIQENSKSINLNGKDVFISHRRGFEASSTSPIELIMLDESGDPLFSRITRPREEFPDFSFAGEHPSFFTGSTSSFGHKILVDNFNRFAVVPDYVAGNSDFLMFYDRTEMIFSPRIAYNYPTERSVLELTNSKARMSGDIPRGRRDVVLGRLADYWSTLTPESKDAINTIGVIDRSDFDIRIKDTDLPSSTCGFAAYSRDIFIREDCFNLEVFRHEVAHARDRSLFRFDQASGEMISEFELAWQNIDKDYFFGSAVTPYGRKNIREDIAEYVKEIYDPSFIDLISSSEPRYRAKLDLLYKYKFISDKEYYDVLEMAGVR